MHLMAFEIGFVLFPRLTQLDLTGPFEILSRLPGAKVSIVAKTLDPVLGDSGLGLVPNETFASCGALDLICVPGGMGVPAAMQDAETIDFVRRQAKGAKYVTSVCTGAFVLGAAGLLKDKRATTHWAYTDLLPLVGATHEKARVVRDGNVITGGGVTAGIDFGLTVLAEVAGPDVARRVQLAVEYDPAPPFQSGNPGSASAEVLNALAPIYAKRVGDYRAAIERAMAA
jgi:cyclohexyl-isocyanide hydratase